MKSKQPQTENQSQVHLEVRISEAEGLWEDGWVCRGLIPATLLAEKDEALEQASK